MAMIFILAVGKDPMILSTRCAILQSGGYVVRPASSVEESIDLFHDSDFDLLLLCHSLSLEDRDRLIRFIRSTSSRIPIYVIESAARGFEAGLADGTLSCRPDDLIKQLGNVMEFAPRIRAQAACH